MISNIRKLFLIFGLFSVILILAACGIEKGISKDPSGDASDIPGEVPLRYRELENPLVGDSEALARGSEAYQALCSQCHGEGGEGDGQEAKGFKPAPGDITRPEMAGKSDGYFYWRITDGGAFEPFKSLMPAWGSLLNETEVWELVSYLREISS